MKLRDLSIIVNVVAIVVGFVAYWLWDHAVPDYSKEEWNETTI